MAKREPQRYRCYHTEKTTFGEHVVSDTGVNPFVDVDATSGEEAARIAHKQTGCPIAETIRLDGPQPRAPRPHRPARPKIVLMTGAAMLAALTACGGGEDDQAGIDPPNCAASAGVCK